MGSVPWDGGSEFLLTAPNVDENTETTAAAGDAGAPRVESGPASGNGYPSPSPAAQRGGVAGPGGAADAGYPAWAADAEGTEDAWRPGQLSSGLQAFLRGEETACPEWYAGELHHHHHG